MLVGRFNISCMAGDDLFLKARDRLCVFSYEREAHFQAVFTLECLRNVYFRYILLCRLRLARPHSCQSRECKPPSF